MSATMPTAGRGPAVGGNGTATAQLLGLRSGDDPYARSGADLLDLQLAAFTERLEQRRRQIPVLDQRAMDVGINEPQNLEDVAPLLFSHQTYKSYPESFVTNAQWQRMGQWLRTITTMNPTGVDLSGVTDVDSWLRRLDESGLRVHATSGTTGKSGFLPMSGVDVGNHSGPAGFGVAAMRWLLRAEPGRRWPLFLLAPRTGPRKYVDANTALEREFGRPDAVHYLSERPDTVAEINRLGALRAAMGAGTALPEQIRELRDASTDRAEASAHDLAGLVDRLLEHRGEDVLVRAGWDPLWMLITELRNRGMDGTIAGPGSIVWTGGGRKAGALPDDALEQIRAFFSTARFADTYGMSEVVPWFPQCAALRWHLPAQILLVLLDETGEQVRNTRGGRVEGRAGLFDVTLDGRWGGVITSDRLVVDFDPCPCGLASTSVLEVGRFEGTDDDKLTCAGTISAYIRGIVDE